MTEMWNSYDESGVFFFVSVFFSLFPACHPYVVFKLLWDVNYLAKLAALFCSVSSKVFELWI
jgi:hypothetical protein